MELERRFCAQHGLRLDRRAEDKLPMIAGYAAVFNTLSVDLWGFREKIAPGAFAGSLNDDVRALWNHETGIVLGRTKSGTLRLAEDDTGLAIEIDPPASAGNYIETIKRGDVDQMSFAFRTLEQAWDEDDDGVLIRTLLKVKLYEVSPVTFPAYPATNVGVRSGRVDQVYGVIPEIPAEFRRASNSASHTAADLARARYEQRHRKLQLLG
jgi:HK97 family phage prohead protease